MPEAWVNGVRIWYQETGVGEPVIQIHGAGFGHFNFSTATPILSNSFRCIDFDMRGYGKSERPFQPYDMEVWADDVAGLMDHLGLRSAHINGTSMGGMVAQQFAAKSHSASSHQLLSGEARLRWHPYVSRLDRRRRAVRHGLTHAGRADRVAGALSPFFGYFRRSARNRYDSYNSAR
jgi:alpha-beta hydrolase superfamily lysophospholipase